MKKAIVCLLSILLILAFVSCNATPDSGSSSAGTTTEPSTGSGTIPKATNEQEKTVKELLRLANTAIEEHLDGVIPPKTPTTSESPKELEFKFTDVSIDGGKLNGRLKTIDDTQVFQNLTFQKESVTSSYEGSFVVDVDSEFVATVNGVKCMMNVSVIIRSY